MGSALVKPPPEDYIDSKTGVSLRRKAGSRSLLSNPFALLSSTRQANRQQDEESATALETEAQVIDRAQTESHSSHENETSREDASASASKSGDELSVTNSLVTRFTVVKVLRRKPVCSRVCPLQNLHLHGSSIT